MPWQKVGRSYKCARHGTTFGLTSSCPGCEADPGPELGAELAAVDLAKPPSGCMSSVQLERWFTALAKRSAAAADRLASLAVQSEKWAEKHRPPAPEVVFPPEEQGNAAVPTIPAALYFDFHLESNQAKHRDVSIKAARAAAQLALLREDAHTVVERERRLKKLKASH